LLTVERISKEVYLSPSRLREKELPISQIALEVGYSDQSYFTKVFKKVEKCTVKPSGKKPSNPKFNKKSRFMP
jgi:AraC-like DNA-binding protein